MIAPVILCGGSGTRLWPLSREAYPKQFLSLVEDETRGSATARAWHRALILRVEPVGRNTGPAVACAGLNSLQMHDDPVLLVLPADHVILDVNAFREAVITGASLAEEGKLVTFGTVPTAPETGL